jgi:phospholipase/carboxylesterase
MADYHYRESKGANDEAPLLVVFHGTGGDENQFFDLAGQLLPGARIVAPRGDVSEGGALRYFRRTGEGVYDMADLALRVGQMQTFLAARKAEGNPSKVIGLGYSNGANILAAVQFAAADMFDGVVLMHPLIPFAPADADFTGRHVLITAGRHDRMASQAATQDLGDYFSRNGAATDIFWHPGGHEIRQEELHKAHAFMGALTQG